MIIQTWAQTLQLSLQSVWYGFVETFPKVLLALIVFILGWIIAVTLARLVTAGIDALKLDGVFNKAGADEVFGRAGWKLHVGGIIGWLVKWLIILGFFIFAVNILGLTQVSGFLQEIWGYIPNVIIAALILIAGTVLADFTRKIIAGSAAIARVRSSRLIGGIAYYTIWILTIVTALDKLGIFGYFGQILFTGIVFTVALAAGLAFGLGGKDVAARWLSRATDEMSSRNRNQM
jgi:hypothetical protein